MEQKLKWLQATALGLAFVAPWIFFVGYSYDSAYFDVLQIDQHMFFKAPQEYFGRAYLVLFGALSESVKSVYEEQLWISLFIIAIIAVILSSVVYFGHTKRWWGRLSHKLKRLSETKSSPVSSRFFTLVIAPVYLALTIPTLFVGALAMIFLALAAPFLIGVRAGQHDAEKIIHEWNDNTCSGRNPTMACVHLVDAGKVVASGVAITASEKLVAIYDGQSVRVYSLDRRELRLDSEKFRSVKKLTPQMPSKNLP